jgi:glycosyltransferase involved in cell wall biosynthesis
MAKTPLRIGFNGGPFCQPGMRGLGRHTLELILGLKQIEPELEISLYCYEEIHHSYKELLPFVKFRDKKIRPKFLWDFFFLAWEIKKDKLDIFHSTNNLGVPLLSGVPSMVTIHDTFTHRARLPWRRGYRNWWAALMYRLELLAVMSAKKFLTVSESAKAEIHEEMMIPNEKIVVTYNGSSFNFPEGEQHKEDYYLYVGGLETRKNIKPMLEAILAFNEKRIPKIPLKLVGSLHGANTEIRGILEKHSELFHLINNVRDSELADYYRKARALIFPSLEEGFGLPLVEAMRSGCPAVVSDIKVFKEIAQESALYFSPQNPSDIKNKLVLLEESPDLAKSLVKSGLERSKEFTWEKMATRTYSEYVKVLNKL